MIKKTTIAILLGTALCAPADNDVFFTLKDTVETVKTNRAVCPVTGHIWTEWRTETSNVPTRATMSKADSLSWLYTGNSVSIGALTNMMYSGNVYFRNPECQKEHWDGTDHQEVSYVQSNLWACIEWRGKTNSDCLESICVKTNTQTWHWEKVKVWK